MKQSGRKPISKSLRFKIFARDEYTCQYCGRRPPEITLQVDHRIPVSRGGTNEAMNLLAACVDCNSGKSNRDPQAATPRPDASERALAAYQEALEYSAYLDACSKRAEMLDSVIFQIQSVWRGVAGGGFYPNDMCVRRWVLRFGPEAVEEAIGRAGMAFASHKISAATEPLCEGAIRYVGGILWQMERGDDGADT